MRGKRNFGASRTFLVPVWRRHREVDFASNSNDWWSIQDENTNYRIDLPRPEFCRSPAGLRPGTLISEVREILHENGRPMHQKAILRVLGWPASRSTRGSVHGLLRDNILRGRDFTQTGPATFGLVEWAQLSGTSKHGGKPVLGIKDRGAGVRQITTRSQVRAILLSRAVPMRSNDILLALGEEPTPAARGRLASLLNPWVKRKVEFTRPAPSTFGLTDWKGSLSKKWGGRDEYPCAPKAFRTALANVRSGAT